MSRLSSAWGLRAAAITALVTIAALSTPIGAQLPQTQPARSADYENFDIRRSDDAAVRTLLGRFASTASAGATADFQAANLAAVAQLKSDFSGLVVENIPEIGTPEVVGVRPGTGFLTPPSADRVGTFRQFLTDRTAAYGLAPDQMSTLQLVADYENPSGNMAWVEFEQRINGLPVFLGTVRGAFTARGELAQTTGQLAPGLDPKSLPTEARLTAAQAVAGAAATVGVAIDASALSERSNVDGRVTLTSTAMSDDARAWLLYFPLSPGSARLAWCTELWGAESAYMIVVDAEDGTLLFRKSLTAYQSQTATYNVYTSDSPAPLSPTTAIPGANTQGSLVSRTSVTLIGNEAPNTFNSLGWITDGANSTDGNNVEAGLDVDGTNGVDAPLTGSSRVFSYSYTPGTDAPSTTEFRSGEITDAFYWTNKYHDSLYLLGFTEPARNFQNANFSRGGVESDRVRAELQDSSGTNNANFATFSDGSRPRMQMYIFPGPSPDRTSGLDHDVLIHELQHGTSARLHGNAAGLSTTMSGGMNEGWSDFFARALLSTSDEDVNGVYAMGGWVTYQFGSASYTDNYYYGIRRFPYAVLSNTGGPSSRPHNPLTFADISASTVNLTDGAYSPSTIPSTSAFQVHNIGEVWASMLFEVRARFIARLGFDTGNQRIMQYVIDAMKLEPISPTFLQGRDAIIAAANAGGGTAADILDIRTGFAARGLGYSAQITSLTSSTVTVVESYSVTAPSITINDVSVTEGNSGTTTATFTVSLSSALSGALTLNYATADNTATAKTLSNTAAIWLPAGGTATAYPSTITMPSGLGTIQKVTVRLNRFGHTWPDDVDVLLVGPGGQTSILMSDIGNSVDVSELNLTFDDDASTALTTATPTSGTYQPSNVGSGDTWPSPAPAATGTVLSAFNGLDPAGDWKLYITDDVAVDAGAFLGGWTLSIKTSSSDYVAQSGTLTFSSGETSKTIAVVVNGDTVNEASETFAVNLSGTTVADITDSQGVGTITTEENPVFTDSVLTAGSSVIKVIHISELRDRINAIRANRGMSAYSFTDSLTAQSTAVKATHILELRTALAEAYSNAGRTPPTYTGTTPAAGVVISTSVITELRAAVVAIE